MDHNMDFLKHSVHKRMQEFIELNLDNNLIPTITRPTRITKSTATLIDNIIASQSLLTNSDSRIIIVIIIIIISNHLPSLVKFRDLLQKNNSVKIITSRNLCKKNIERMKNDLETTDWPAVITESVDESFDSFHDLLIDTVNKHSPIITRKISRNKFRKEPWVSASILRSINTQKKLYAKSIKSNASTRDMIKYKNYKKILDRLKRMGKTHYYQTKCVEFKNNIKKLWELINKVIGKTSDKGSIINYIKVNDIDILKEKEIADEFGKYFASVGKTFAGKVIPPKHNNLYYINKIVHNPKSLYMHCTTESEIEKLINKLPNKTSSGYDNLSNVLIKKLGTTLTKPLSLIFNNSISQGIFPNKMKLAETTPLYKSKETHYTTNYRPISLLITISKILEKIVYKRVYNFLHQTGQLYNSQYGFRTAHSCDNAVSELVGAILKNRENNKFTAALYLDLSKAFDTLEPSVLYHKLEKYGIRGNCLDWFRSYLTNRKLRSKCKLLSGTEYSDWYDVEYGTPQGSCLGPLLFLIFCNDLQKNLEFAECIQFADDTTLYFGHTNKNFMLCCLEHDLTIISDWFRANKLTLNVNKTVFMLFHPKGKKSDEYITFEDKKIRNSHETKFLGKWLNDNMSWESHIRQLTIKIKRNMSLLRKSKNILKTNAMLPIYYGHIHSHLKYGILLWGSMINQNQFRRIQTLQNKAVKLIHSSMHLDRIYRMYKIPNLKQLITMEQHKFAYRLVNDLLPENLLKAARTDPKGLTLRKTHVYNTRMKAEPNLPFTKSLLYHNSFLHQSIKLFSTLPVEIKSKNSLLTFSKSIKKLMSTF